MNGGGPPRPKPCGDSRQRSQLAVDGLDVAPFSRDAPGIRRTICF
jgi:hypothetical protein